MNIWSLEWRVAAIRNGIGNALAYRGDFIMEVLGSALVPVAIQLILWYSIFHNTGTSSFGGMNYTQLLAYTWTSLLFSQIRGGDYDFSLVEMIRTGSLSNYLLRPVGVVEFTFFQGFGERLVTSAVCFLIGVAVTFFSDISLVHLLMGMSLAILGNIIHYLFGATLATVGFYWENGFSILMVKNMVVGLFSGEIIPLNIVPEKYAWIWKSTPFYLYVYGPTQITLGKWNAVMWMQQMLIGFAWLLGLWLLMRILWSASIKRYQGIGG